MAKTLDDVVKEQAAYYGMTEEQFSKTMHDVAVYQEQIEEEGKDA